MGLLGVQDAITSPRTALLGLIGVSVFLYTLWRCIYNVWFHPLARFPGPFLAKISPVSPPQLIRFDIHLTGGRYTAYTASFAAGGPWTYTSCT